MKSHSYFKSNGKNFPIFIFSWPLRAIIALAILFFLLLCGRSLAGTVLDFNELSRRGLSEKSREIIVAQALTVRARPPLEVSFILELASYGGDELARAYLEMDARTNQMSQSPLAPETIKSFMNAKMASSDLISMMEKTVTPSLKTAGSFKEPIKDDRQLEPSLARQSPPSAMVAQVNQPTDYEAMIAATAPQIPALAGQHNLTPQAAVRANNNQSASAILRKTPQVLAPGQQADPSRPLPADSGPYWVRTPQPQDVFFMGVIDEVKADGHQYEVNSNARRGLLGQEALSRASGHRVVRHYNGQTKRTYQSEREVEISEANLLEPYIEPQSAKGSGFDYLTRRIR
ncbi:MAG: hypothetical protein LBV23_08590 [Deltaproteobacteria bacterium]|jgi:hypothetical protein|nr:hypothetical protein [Deltaproteobacteria bacterium]